MLLDDLLGPIKVPKSRIGTKLYFFAARILIVEQFAVRGRNHGIGSAMNEKDGNLEGSVSNVDYRSI